MPYPKRLIEVDLPIARISAHARREKSIRHGHISTLHIWWARRPLAACRAVICAALWPDPVDPLCPPAFRDAAAHLMTEFAQRVVGKGKIAGPSLLDTCSPESLAGWEEFAKSQNVATTKANRETETGGPTDVSLREALLDFIADFANWDNSTVPAYLETSRALTQAAHEALGGEPGTRPLVVDPFAGGGSIPLEALRVGADAFASDLNPVAVLLNKVVLEYIPKYGQRLADEVRKWGQWIKEQAEKELAEFYPKDPDGASPIAYLWARTIRCEGPGCGAEVPLIRSLWLAKGRNRAVALQLVPDPHAKQVEFKIIVKERGGWVDQSNSQTTITHTTFDGAVKRGSASCPCCNYTTPVARVREQLKSRKGGASDSRLFCVVSLRPGESGRHYRLPNEVDMAAIRRSHTELERRKRSDHGAISIVPDERLDICGIRHTWGMIYGLDTWEKHFTPRQLVALTTLGALIRRVGLDLSDELERGLAVAVQTCLSLNFSRVADLSNSLCGWKLDVQCPTHLFARQAIPMVWDFSESVCLSESSGSWHVMTERLASILSSIGFDWNEGVAQQASATAHPLPSRSVSAFISDPPYYDAVPYAYLSDFFYVWLRRNLISVHPELFKEPVVPKDEEIVVDRPHELSHSTHDIAFYERELAKAFCEARRVLRPDGIGTIVFASKTTSSWEAILKAVVDAGWVITGSWPIDTEMETRVSAQGQARLASSIHLVCRPREDANEVVTETVGEWRDVLGELPNRIHDWMPRLAAEGVVGADAIFACLGPALEVFSRYSRVEKANGEQATLREYLEHVWAAVSTEALSLIFREADASGLEPDARLTAMWLWTIGGGTGQSNGNGRALPAVSGGDPAGEESDVADEEDEESRKALKVSGYTLEFDAARKIAQGLGADLERCETIVEVKGDKARLLPVAERAMHLFGRKTDTAQTAASRGKKRSKQKSLFDELGDASSGDGGLGDINGPSPGTTALDRLHQAMILFATGRGDALKRFLVDDGVGRDARFWNLAQSLSALYPKGTDEKRWVDGVLARKKGLGL